METIHCVEKWPLRGCVAGALLQTQYTDLEKESELLP